MMQADMARTSTFDLHDRHMNGELTVLLKQWRADGLTFEQISHRLMLDHGITVATSTVHRWCRNLEAAA